MPIDADKYAPVIMHLFDRQPFPLLTKLLRSSND